MKRILCLSTILLTVVFSVSHIFAGYSWKETSISRVLDSNSFQIVDNEIFRIIGIEELDEFSADKREVCHYRSNSREIKKLLLNNEIFAAKDEIIIDALHLKIDKEYVTETILLNGWAKMNEDAVSSYFKSLFEKAQDFAKNNQLGIWAPCPNDLNWQKIRDNFGGRMSEFKKENAVFLGEVAVGVVEKVISGNEFKLRDGPTVILQNVEIPSNTNQANACFLEQSRNYLENILLNKKVRIEKEINSRDIVDYKLVRDVYINGKSKEISINQKMINDGFGKYSGSGVFSIIQLEVYDNPRGAWEICARDILNTDFSNTKKEEIREIDESCPIKGNVSGTKKSPIKTYHTVLSGWYERIKPEQCFQNEETANLAGFRKIK